MDDFRTHRNPVQVPPLARNHSGQDLKRDRSQVDIGTAYDASYSFKRRSCNSTRSVPREVEVISLLSSDEEDECIPLPHTTLRSFRAQISGQVHDITSSRKPLGDISNLESVHNSSLPDVSPTLKTEIYLSSNASPRDPAVIPTEPKLCKEQQDLVDLISSGKNVFYTGSAGCGKSTVLKAFVKRLRNEGKQVNIIAPTGRAALDINGSTTWTYAGWTPDSHKKAIKKLREAAHGKFVMKRLKATDVLVIDEISMVENLHFERINHLMKEARRREDAFGGVQLVVTGDFCQLPPVKPFQHCIECGRELQANLTQTEYTCVEHGKYFDIDKWAFRSKAWGECRFVHVNLTNIHRQSDKVFIDLLQRCRLGLNLSQKDEDLLLNHPSSTENAVKLYSTREEVRRVNLEAFQKLRTPPIRYRCYDHFRHNPEHKHLRWKTARSPFDNSLTALQDHRFDAWIEVKEGMLVVLLVNLDLQAGLVNGSQGVIVGFEEYDPAKLPKALSESEKRSNASIPNVLIGDHVHLRETNIQRFIDQADRKKWPIVHFDNDVTRTIYADCRVHELGDELPYSLLSRTQIPLTAAWAMTIHKSQGMTLNRVVVNLSKNFEEGQMYVALSRARSLEGLKVEGLGSCMGGGNEQVKEFLRQKFGIMG